MDIKEDKNAAYIEAINNINNIKNSDFSDDKILRLIKDLLKCVTTEHKSGGIEKGFPMTMCMGLFEAIKDKGVNFELVTRPRSYNTVIGKGHTENTETTISIGHKKELNSRVNSFFSYYNILIEEFDNRTGLKRVADCTVFPGTSSINTTLEIDSGLYRQVQGKEQLRPIEEYKAKVEFCDANYLFPCGDILKSELNKQVDGEMTNFIRYEAEKGYGNVESRFIMGTPEYQRVYDLVPSFLVKFVPYVPYFTGKPGYTGKKDLINDSKYYCSTDLMKKCFPQAYKMFHEESDIDR